MKPPLLMSKEGTIASQNKHLNRSLYSVPFPVLTNDVIKFSITDVVSDLDNIPSVIYAGDDVHTNTATLDVSVGLSYVRRYAMIDKDLGPNEVYSNTAQLDVSVGLTYKQVYESANVVYRGNEVHTNTASLDVSIGMSYRNLIAKHTQLKEHISFSLTNIGK